MIIHRGNILSLLNKTRKSILLLGPRQTGKTTIIKSLSPDLTINLADEVQFLNFARNPSEIQSRIARAKPKTVFVDEIQRLPSLLNSVQVILDESKGEIRFFLTGSSARKLKRGQANLLPGRVIAFELGPLVTGDFDYKMDGDLALSVGTLPGIYTEESAMDRQRLLETYGATYVKEEILAEALTRNLEGFSRLLGVVASRATQFVDFAKFGSEALIDRQSAMRYLEILEDTLILWRAFPFTKSSKKRLVQHPRFYFFDNGVLNGLLGNFNVSADRKGMLFENLIFSQIYYGAKMSGNRIEIGTYRTEHAAEVDFVVSLNNEIWAIEAKASTNISETDLRGLKNFREFYGKKCHCAVAYEGSVEKELCGVSILPWQKLMKEMGL